ncbi:hypothetical protein KAFR_0E01350 [Kazachstania africana CBS 2517]|uniref:ATP synthase subunit 5, mitochondrial n=1 Tax=Kazachstania africana (strain ATCC 22294 / BCRC 22015 / CBS 2517 / CECT 1963 / NBRC 1671 / NRRL Y-8276) TaxID=1071382 RepID=H2AV89_KAZAF|nr:hypothetical protein KAFR_0E01350 [Kazachstania africana CBS 2517]CCF58289.1 hypothetical protein KAFR_0E01350 [Kazachstania africana CBS 2517]
MLRVSVKRVFHSVGPRLSQMQGVENTYAKSLFNVVKTNSAQLQSVSKSLLGLNELVSKDEKLHSVFDNPSLSLDDRVAVVNAIVETQPQLNPNIVNFLKVIAENNRLYMLTDIVSSFQKMNDDFNGIVNATVTTIEPLDSKSLKRLEKAITQSKFIGPNNALKLRNTVNPDIKGGLVLEIDEKTVDLSVASKIQKLNKLLNEDI